MRSATLIISALLQSGFYRIIECRCLIKSRERSKVFSICIKWVIVYYEKLDMTSWTYGILSNVNSYIPDNNLNIRFYMRPCLNIVLNVSFLRILWSKITEPAYLTTCYLQQKFWRFDPGFLLSSSPWRYSATRNNSQQKS